MPAPYPTDVEERKQLIKWWLDTVIKDYEPKGEWEENFIISIEAQWKKKGNLSDKQLEIIERMYEAT